MLNALYTPSLVIDPFFIASSKSSSLDIDSGICASETTWRHPLNKELTRCGDWKICHHADDSPLQCRGRSEDVKEKWKRSFFSFLFSNFSSWRSSRCSQNLFPDATGENSNTCARVEWVLFHYTTYELVDMYPSCLLCLLKSALRLLSFFCANRIICFFWSEAATIFTLRHSVYHLNKSNYFKSFSSPVKKLFTLVVRTSFDIWEEVWTLIMRVCVCVRRRFASPILDLQPRHGLPWCGCGCF